MEKMTKKVVALFKQGVTISEIRKKLHLSSAIVYYHLGAGKVTLKGRGGTFRKETLITSITKTRGGLLRLPIPDKIRKVFNLRYEDQIRWTPGKVRILLKKVKKGEIHESDKKGR